MSTSEMTARDESWRDRVDELEAAASRVDAAETAVEDVGRDRLEAVASALREAEGVLERYEESATGSGDFGAYVEFLEKFSTLIEGLDDDLPARPAFESANERMDKRRLSTSDFEGARQDLEPARELASRLTTLESARGEYRDARAAVRRTDGIVEKRIADHERLLEFADVPLDASVDAIREPVAHANEAIRRDFDAFLHEAPARDVFAFVEAVDAYPLVEVRSVPPELASYAEDAPAGTESVSTLREWAGFSASKLEHYVEDLTTFRGAVATNRRYLESLDATPLTVAWPPAPADRLRWRLQEVQSVVARFASDETVATVRDLQAVCRRDDFDALRAVAVAREELTDAERDRLAAGEVEAALERDRSIRSSLEAALETHPAR